jgi:type III pantothenate kinase
VDRWLAMIAARRLVQGAFAVVCAGTAVTFDAVDAGGRHLGGLILPGDRLMIESMANNAHQIPLVPAATQAVRGLDLLGRSTAEAVSRGSRLALAAAVDRAVEQVAESLAQELAVVVTGGDAPVLAPWLESKVSVSPDLVLDGLAVVAADGE